MYPNLSMGRLKGVDYKKTLDLYGTICTALPRRSAYSFMQEE